MSFSFYTFSLLITCHTTFYRPIILVLCLLYCITDTTQVAEGRMLVSPALNLAPFLYTWFSHMHFNLYKNFPIFFISVILVQLTISYVLFIYVQHIYTVVTAVVLRTRIDPPNHLQKSWYLSVTAHSVASRVNIIVTAPSWESHTSWPCRQTDIRDFMSSIRNSAYFHHIIHPPFINNTAYTNPYTCQESPFRLQEDGAPRISTQSAR